MAFHTAPPQPASNARITWPPVFVGGPEASQNGLGDSIPQNFTRKSAMSHLANRNSHISHFAQQYLTGVVNSVLGYLFFASRLAANCAKRAKPQSRSCRANRAFG